MQIQKLVFCAGDKPFNCKSLYIEDIKVVIFDFNIIISVPFYVCDLKKISLTLIVPGINLRTEVPLMMKDKNFKGKY